MSRVPGVNRQPRRTTSLSWRATLTIFARYWLAERRTVTIIVLLLLLLIAAEAVTPVAFGELIGAVAGTGAQDSAQKDIGQAFVLVAASLVAAILLRQLLDRHWNSLTVRSMQRLQLDLFARVQRFSTDWHAGSFAGATVHRISRARWALDMLSNIIILRLLQPAILILVLGTMMTMRLPAAGVIFFIMCGLFIVISLLLSIKWVRPMSMQSAARDSRLTGALADAIGNNASVKAFAAEAREDQRLRAISDEWAGLALTSFDRATDTNAIQMLVWAAAQLFVIGVIAWFSLTGQTTVADSAFAISATMLLSGQLRNLGQDIRTIQRAYAELEDAAEFLVVTPETGIESAALPRPEIRGEIAFQHVSFSYPAGKPQYEDLSFTIRAGEQVALVGPSGSGKSTIIKLIQRLYQPQSGGIAIDGVDIASMTTERLRSLISVVPQEPLLFHRTLAENIGYGRPDATLPEIIEAAKQARAHDFISRQDKGYSGFVGERGVKLSGGERQRIAIARAMLADRPILLLDEATSSLDTETERLVQEAIDELARGRTTIIIAHRLSTVRRVDRILVFDNGQIIEEGSHDDLVKRPGGYYRYLYELQSHAENDMLDYQV
ncbi:MAG: ABC transporter ATP-binding protein [Sphingomonadaceae bacterium]